MPSHLLFLDDSGTKRYAKSISDYGSGNTRYFVFGGVLLPQAEAEGLTRGVRAVKERCFGTPNVEIKSNWLRMPEERRERYLEPYGITEGGLRDFVEDFYEVIENGDLMLVAGVVDKIHMQEDYATPWYPPAVAYEAILQRVEDELAGSGTVSVTIDDMTGSTPKRNQYKDNLKQQHKLLKQHGSRLLKGFDFTTLEGRVKFAPSETSELIQIADVAAYNVYRQFREHGEAWEAYDGEPLPTYPYFMRLAKKFRQSPSGRVQGYGVVKVPLRKRIPWGFVEDEDEDEVNGTAP